MSLDTKHWHYQESLLSFLKHDRCRIMNYINSLPLSPNEQQRYDYLTRQLSSIDNTAELKTAEFNRLMPEYRANPATVLPFEQWPKLKQPTYQKDTVSEAYLEHGVVGPYRHDRLDAAMCERLCQIAQQEKRSNQESGAVHITCRHALELATSEALINPLRKILGDDIILLIGLIHVVPSQEYPAPAISHFNCA